ncbi:MAG: hypothetical protein ACYTHJ_22200, partial [Planctomycetota bacterium]
ILAWPLYLLSVFAVLIQVLVRSKLAGMLGTLVLFLGLNVLSSLGFEHGLYQIGLVAPRFSDLNGWGHFVEPMLAFGAYGALVATLAGVVAHLFYRRGYVDSLRERLAIASRRLTVPVVTVAVVGTLSAASVGGWIFYNTNVLNSYETNDDLEALQADYERTYKRLQSLAKPEAVRMSERRPWTSCT